MGSGVIIDQRGYIVTNQHVIKNAGHISVILSNGSQMDAEIVGTGARTDLALLKINGVDFPTAILGGSDQMAMGELLLPSATPAGLTLPVPLHRGSSAG